MVIKHEPLDDPAPQARPSKKDVVAEFRRSEILDAARRVFARRGFADATVDEIAREAGIAKGTIYLYYKSKGDVYAAAAREGLLALHDQMVSNVRGAVTAFDKVRAFIETKTRYFERNVDFFRLYYAELNDLAAHASGVNEQSQRLYLEQIELLRTELQREFPDRTGPGPRGDGHQRAHVWRHHAAPEGLVHVEPGSRHRLRRVLRVAGSVRAMKAHVAPAFALLLAMASPALAQTSGLPAVFQGGVPSGERTAQPLTLTLGDAVQRGLEHNLGVLLEEQRVQSAEGAHWRAMSGLLPDVSGSLSAAREKINLAAFGFKAPGIPQLVGPFNLYDARLRLSQPVLDLSALSDAKAASKSVEAQKATYADTRSLVLAAVTNLYLVAVAERSRVEAAEAAEHTADTVHRLAVDQVAAGVVPRLDALRSDVEFGNARQRLIVTRNDLDKAKLALARAIGLPPGQVFNLADSLPFVPEPSVNVESAASLAYAARDDYKAAQARVAAAEDAARAAWQTRLPTLTVDADYGTIGNTFDSMLPTFTVGANVHVPIFSAGRTKARTIEANAELRSRRAEAEELRGRIYYDVQASALDLAAASAQIGVARDAVSVAEQALEQAEDRFKAGVANNLEVVQAQQALTTSRENYIASLYADSVAKAALARAMGIGEKEFLQLLEGTMSWPKTQ